VPAQAAAAAPAPAGAWLTQRRVLVLEDEPAVRRGLEALLRSWGAEVLAFDGAAACAGWAREAGAARPDVLLLDQRLEGGPSGGDVLALLRARFGAGLPALVVTGDAAASAAQLEALGAGLLVKPVLPNRLRQALAQALGLR
jgi:CheY-like chemotaxis protein